MDLAIPVQAAETNDRDRLIQDDVSLTLYSDGSSIIGRLKDNCEILFPIGVMLDTESLAYVIGDAFSQVRMRAGHSRLSQKEMSQVDVSDLCTMLHAPVCEDILRDLFADAERLLRARAPMGPIQFSPSNSHASGFFPPLRGLPRLSARDNRSFERLYTALQAELSNLVENVPFLRNEHVRLIVKGSVPDRDGALRPPTAHLLMNEQPMDEEVESLIQPILDAYCASASLVPDRAQFCEYQHGRIGHNAHSSAEPLPALEPTNIMVIAPKSDATAHERIEMTSLRHEHQEEIYACADLLDIPWNQNAPQHAQHYGENNA
jgi:hypothetical protein